MSGHIVDCLLIIEAEGKSMCIDTAKDVQRLCKELYSKYMCFNFSIIDLYLSLNVSSKEFIEFIHSKTPEEKDKKKDYRLWVSFYDFLSYYIKLMSNRSVYNELYKMKKTFINVSCETPEKTQSLCRELYSKALVRRHLLLVTDTKKETMERFLMLTDPGEKDKILKGCCTSRLLGEEEKTWYLIKKCLEVYIEIVCYTILQTTSF